MVIKHVFVDIDDTMVSTDGKPPQDDYLGFKQMNSLIDRANKGELPPIGFISGREVPYILGVARTFRMPKSLSIAESGLVLVNLMTGERRYHPALTPEKRKLFQCLWQERIPKLQEKFPYLLPYIGKEVNIAIERIDLKISMEECGEIVRKEFEDLLKSDLIEFNVSSIAVDLSPKGIDKGTGILYHAEITRINPSEELVIGDSLGDKPAADKVRFLACPENAKPAFKELVRARNRDGYISPYPYAQGVADSICHFTGASLP